jgi:hypothetical protein
MIFWTTSGNPMPTLGLPISMSERSELITFHQLKQWIQHNFREGQAAMDCLLGPTHPLAFFFEALDSITAEDIQGFFHDTGYSI